MTNEIMQGRLQRKADKQVRKERAKFRQTPEGKKVTAAKHGYTNNMAIYKSLLKEIQKTQDRIAQLQDNANTHLLLANAYAKMLEILGQPID